MGVAVLGTAVAVAADVAVAVPGPAVGVSGATVAVAATAVAVAATVAVGATGVGSGVSVAGRGVHVGGISGSGKRPCRSWKSPSTVIGSGKAPQIVSLYSPLTSTASSSKVTSPAITNWRSTGSPASSPMMRGEARANWLPRYRPATCGPMPRGTGCRAGTPGNGVGPTGVAMIVASFV